MPSRLEMLKRELSWARQERERLIANHSDAERIAAHDKAIEGLLTLIERETHDQPKKPEE